MKGIYETLLELLDRKQDAVLATIIEEEGSSPRGTGAQMLIGPDGLAAGTIGGGVSEGTAIERSTELLREKHSEQKRFRLRWDPKEKENPVCGGEITVFLQYIAHDGPWRPVVEKLLERQEAKQPCWLTLRLDGGTPGLLDEKSRLLAGENPEAQTCLAASKAVLTKGLFSLPMLPGERAVIFGGGHCAHALAPLLETVGFRVTVFDDRPEFANRARFPAAEKVVVGDYSHIAASLDLTPEDYAIVMTTGHQHDFEVEEQLLRLPLAYVGVIGSRTKTAYVNQRLREAGISEEAIQSVHTPIGTAIRAVTPEEIAVSIAGELILCRAERRGMPENIPAPCVDGTGILWYTVPIERRTFMHFDDYNYNPGYAVEPIETYTAKTFAWMFLGLLATFGVALFGYATGTILYLFLIPYFQVILLVVELAVVLFLSARIHKLSIPAARGLFFAYAVLNGIVFSAYFLIYGMLSLILAFAMTAVYFGAMALYGYFTRTDLSRLRPVLLGGLFFLILFGIASMFLPMASAERVVCLVGVAIFLGFTAYDTQKIRMYYTAYQSDPAMLEKASIISALQLYLDFINLFLYLLRFLNRNRK